MGVRVPREGDCLSFLTATFRTALEFTNSLGKGAWVPLVPQSLQPGLEPSLLGEKRGEWERETLRHCPVWGSRLWVSQRS